MKEELEKVVEGVSNLTSDSPHLEGHLEKLLEPLQKNHSHHLFDEKAPLYLTKLLINLSDLNTPQLVIPVKLLSTLSKKASLPTAGAKLLLDHINKFTELGLRKKVSYFLNVLLNIFKFSDNNLLLPLLDKMKLKRYTEEVSKLSKHMLKQTENNKVEFLTLAVRLGELSLLKQAMEISTCLDQDEFDQFIQFLITFLCTDNHFDALLFATDFIAFFAENNLEIKKELIENLDAFPSHVRVIFNAQFFYYQDELVPKLKLRTERNVKFLKEVGKVRSELNKLGEEFPEMDFIGEMMLS